MKFMIGEGGWSWLERMAYRGAIGLFYSTTWGGVLAYIIFTAMCIFAVIGMVTVLKWIFTRKRKPRDPYKEWIKTGKM